MQQRRHYVNQIGHALVAHSGGDLLGPRDDQRHSRQAVVEDPALALHGVFAHEVAVVRTKDHNRLLPQPQFVELVEDLAERVVDKAHHAKVRGHDAVEVFGRVAAHSQHLVERPVALGGALVVEFVVAPGGQVNGRGWEQGCVLGWT